MTISEEYKKGYDNIKWGEGTVQKKIEPQKLDGHYIIKFERG
jgi:hypothetical protein